MNWLDKELLFILIITKFEVTVVKKWEEKREKGKILSLKILKWHKPDSYLLFSLCLSPIEQGLWEEGEKKKEREERC